MEFKIDEGKLKEALGFAKDDPKVKFNVTFGEPITAPVTNLDDDLAEVLAEVGDEVMTAAAKFPRFNSPHEGYAVIKEGLDELWEVIKGNEGRGEDAHEEAVQVAAMAVRYLLDLIE